MYKKQYLSSLPQHHILHPVISTEKSGCRYTALSYHTSPAMSTRIIKIFLLNIKVKNTALYYTAPGTTHSVLQVCVVIIPRLCAGPSSSCPLLPLNSSKREEAAVRPVEGIRFRPHKKLLIFSLKIWALRQYRLFTA